MRTDEVDRVLDRERDRARRETERVLRDCIRIAQDGGSKPFLDVGSLRKKKPPKHRTMREMLIAVGAWTPEIDRYL